MSRQVLPLSCQNHPNLIWRHFSHLLSTQHSTYGHACTLVSMGMNHNMYMYEVAFFFQIVGVGDNSGFTAGLEQLATGFGESALRMWGPHCVRQPG